MRNPRLLFWGSFVGSILIVLAIVVFFSLQNSSRMSELSEVYADWSLVLGKVSPFEARLPKAPEYASEDLPIPGTEQKIRQEMYVSGSDDASYFVTATLYPEEVTGDEEENLTAALDGMMEAIPGAQVLSSHYTVPFSGSNYLEFESRNPANDTHYKGRLYLADRSLYQVYLSYPTASYNDDEYTYFVNSLTIK